MLLLALLAPWAANAQETLTVYDETTGTLTNNAYVPIYGNYLDNYTKCEFVIPADQLEAMVGGEISALKFYIQQVGTYGSGWSSNQQVFLKEVESTSLSAWSGTDDATIVWEGSFTVPASNATEFDITFNTPYEYQGGNLLIGIYNTTKGGYRDVKWYGQSVSGASGCANTSTALSSVSFTQRNFIPKTTFTYTPGTPSTCEKPGDISVSSITENTAYVSWTGGSGTFNVEYKKASDAEWTRYLTEVGQNCMLVNLDPATTYSVRVQSVCGEEVSVWKTASFTTACGVISAFPMTYTFETSDGFPSNASTPTTNQLGSCWRNEATVQTGNYSTRVWGTSTSNKKNGSQSLILPDKGNSSNPAKTMLVFPAMNFTSANGYVVSFWVYRNSTGSNPEGFKVYASDTDTIGDNAVELGHYSRNYNIAYPQIESASDWYYYETDAITMTGTVYIIFEGQSYYGNATYVDDVTIKVAPSCLRPTELNASNITTHTADLSWTANSGETEWTLYYKKTSDENYTEVANVTENPYTLPNLTASSNYQFYVVANCSATDNSEESDVKTFVTECDVISAVGYSENFDSYTTGNNVLPVCWKYINTTSYSSYQGYPKVYNYNPSSTPNCLYFSSYYSTYYAYDPQPQYAILPEMSDLAGKQITLQARGSNTSSTFKVGTMSDPTDASTFTEITGSIDNPAAMTTAYQEYTFYIPVNITDRYVAIMIEAANSSITSNGVYIDDIEFSVAPTCWQPQNLAASDVTNNSATLAWERHAMGDETAWVLQYGTDENFGDGTYTEVTPSTNPTYTIDGALAATTTYYVRVKPACDNDGNLWSETINFTTEASCMVPNQLAISNVTAHEATLTWNGNNDHFIVERGAFDNTGTPVAVTYMNEGFESGSLPEGWTNEGDGAWTVGSGDGNTSGAHAGSYNAKRTGSSGGGASTYLVTPAMNLGGYASATINLYYMNTPWSSDIDDFGVYYRVNGGEWNELFSVSTGHSSWTEMGTVELPNLANNYQIGFKYYDDYGYGVAIDDIVIEAMEYPIAWTVVDNNVPYDANANTYTFDNLNPETTYMVRVIGKCGEVTTEPSAYVPFTTTIACPKPTNLVSANVTAHTADLSWNVNGSVATSWVLTVNGGDIEINSSAVTITNGVASYTLTGLDGETEYTVSVMANCGDDDGTSLPSNEVSFATEISCFAPTALTVTDSTTSTMTLSWTNGSEGQDAWEIEYKKAGDAEFTRKNVTTNPYTLGELEDGKSYTLRIRANCGETDGLSQWSSEITHATEASCQTPTDITVSDVDGHGATISWTDPTVAGKSYIVMVASENMALNVDFENNSIPSNFTNDDNYPWYVYTGTDCTTKAMRSSNNGVNNSTSAIEVTVNVTEASILSFDFWSRGESDDDSKDWDVSRFYIDGVKIFQYGAHTDWETYSAPIATGTHTLKWDYKKDGTQAGTGDCFYVDNIKITAGASEYVERPATTEHSLVIDDLDPETTYYVKVKGDCGSATSPESEVASFVTLTACNVPTNLTHDDESVTAHNATLSWTENNGATAWQVVYSKANINNSEETVDIDENVVNIDGTTITYTLTGLDGQTTYTVRVKSNCGGVHNDMSVESNSTSFTTLPACYPVGDVITSDITAYSVTVQWTDSYNAGAYVIKQGENVLDGTTTPSVVIDVENLSAVISGLEPEHTYTNGTFKVFADCGSEGMSATGTNVPYFQTEPSCYPVTNVTITGKTATSVTFTWEDTHNPETYVIKEGENVLTGETAHSVVIDPENHTATISGLDENETYAVGTFKVFADCGTTDGQSTGVNVPAFTTLCGAITVDGDNDYTYDFEDATPFGCWTPVAGVTRASSTSNAHNSTYYLRFAGTTSNMVAFPQFTNATNTLAVEFWTRPEGYTYANCGKFSVGYMTNINDASTFVSVETYTYNDWTSNTYVQKTVYFPGAPDDAFIAFRQFDCSTNYYWYVDDVTVSLAPACFPVGTLSAATNITSNTATLNWALVDENQNAWVVEYTTDENFVDDILTADADNNVDFELNGLTPETQYYVRVKADCGSNGYSEPSNIINFTTDAACPTPTDLQESNITNNSATITWDGHGQTVFALRYQKDGESEWNEVEDISDSYVFPENLEGLTTYIVQVKVTSCENETWSDALSFTTKCDPIPVDADNPFTENFDASTFPPTDCWNTISNGTRNWTRNTGQNHNEGGSASAYSGYYGDVYLIMPTLAIANDDEAVVKLSFWSYNTWTGSYDKNSVVLLGNTETELWSPASVSQSWEETTIDLSAYKGQNITLAFKYEGDNAHGWYVDDLKVEFVYNYTKTVNGNSWYAISSPVSTPVVTSVDGLIATGTEKYDFFRYNETNATWENYKVHDFDFENGHGYIYRRTNDATLTFTGTPNNGNDIPVNLSYTEAMDEHLKGFNLIGNPYTTEYALGRECYSLNTNGTWAAQPSSYLVQPFEAVMVQADEAGTYTFTNGSSKDAPKAVEALAIKVNGNGFEDVTYAKLENGKGLNKINHLAEEAPALSIAANGSNYAIAYLGYEVESFPLTLNAQAGTYTIALNSQISSLSYVHLIDNLTGKDIDLLSNAYTFTTDGNSANRFLVKLSPSSLQATEGEIATWNGNSWTVKGEGTLQLFDVMGRKVLSQEVSELSTINTDHLSSGVYVIRLGEKSQKIVVK